MVPSTTRARLPTEPRQASLFASGPPAVTDRPVLVRQPLDDHSWLDLGRGLVDGADTLYDELAATLPWRADRRVMYDRLVDVPRLVAPVSADLLPVALARLGDHMAGRYATTLPSVWANWYRSGSDSVAWHSDRVARTRRNPLVVVVSLGGPRPFLVRPKGGGASRTVTLHSGDVLVMGGATQHRWEHCVPKRRQAAPRLSVMFREGD